MGSGRWDAGQWDNYATTHVRGKTQDQVMSSKSMLPDFDPAKITLRESRDSTDNPNSTPIIIAGDVTGSMGQVAYKFMESRLNALAQEIYDRKPVTDPHIMFMAVGDERFDTAPLQVTQWEADIRIAEQLSKLWVEGNGGGNGTEGYHLPWVFSAFKTEMDSWVRRGKKGVLFSYGDESVPAPLRPEDAKRILGIDISESISAQAALEMVSRTFDVYHFVLVNVGEAARNSKVLPTWRDLLGERAISCKDDSKLAEVIVSILQVRQGIDKDTVVKSWSGATSLVVADALKGLTPGQTSSGTGVVEL